MAQRTGFLSKRPSQRFPLLPRKLAIEYLPIASLELDPRNPRVHKAKQIAQIAKSIQTFGFNVPVLIDGASRVIAGHGRLQACALLGLTEIPVIRLEHLSKHQVQAFLIADNRLTENAQWDERLLGEQLKDLAEAELDFTLEVTGFEMGEIDVMLEGLAPERKGGQDEADQIPDIRGMAPVTRLGDIWLLGPHRILCGDALASISFSLLLQGKCASAVFVDPPYNVPIEGHAVGKGHIHHREFVMGSGEMTSAEFTRFLASAFRLLAKHSAQGTLHFICMDWRHMEELLEAGKTAYSELKNLCVWTKDNAGIGSFYRSQHELIFVFKNGEARHRNNVQLGQFGRNRTNVWQYPGVNSFARSGGEGNLLALHPTVKPVALVADAILDCTMRKDIVFDSFLGSGTTLIAAERTGRVCYGLEIDPLYVDTIVRRWQAFTGAKAAHAASGRSFDEMAQEVGDEEKR